MDVIMELANYGGSKDYKRLAELARTKSIICIVNYRYSEDKPPLRDVAQTMFQKHRERDFFQISARGNGYVTAFSEDDFIRMCEIQDVEFIEPTE